MSLKNRLILFLGRVIRLILRLTGHQASTLPGRLMLILNPQLLEILAAQKSIVLVTGTNGKTTTSTLITQILASLDIKVGSNVSGSNLLWGITTFLALAPRDKQVFVIEIDEGAFSQLTVALKPKLVLITNIFRDQLDRYGEQLAVYNYLAEGLKAWQPQHLILCADDPQVVSLAQFVSCPVSYFGISEEQDQLLGNNPRHRMATDMGVAHCLACGQVFNYDWQSMGHLGAFKCLNCGFSRPEPDYRFQYDLDNNRLYLEAGSLESLVNNHGKPLNRFYQTSIDFALKGLYNAYNACAALALVHVWKQNLKADKLEALSSQSFPELAKVLSLAKPSFGRQEKIKLSNGRYLYFLLVKNPIGFEQVLDLMSHARDSGGILFVFNSQIADSRDISWIWDVPFEQYSLPTDNILVNGQRAGDIYLRLSLASHCPLNQDFNHTNIELVEMLMAKSKPGDAIYLVANYTAMLKLRSELAAKYNFTWRWSENKTQ